MEDCLFRKQDRLVRHIQGAMDFLLKGVGAEARLCKCHVDNAQPLREDVAADAVLVRGVWRFDLQRSPNALILLLARQLLVQLLY